MATHAPTGFDAQLWQRLETLAESAGRSASELADAVLRDFLDENERHLAAIDVGIAAADAGDLIDFDDVEADVQKKLAALSTKR
jgi:predicted transcriptional regulator